MEGPILVDDHDPAVQYDNHWYTGGVAEEFSSTTHSASSEGAQAILTFTGTSVGAYGTLHAPGTPGISTYSIDGKPVTSPQLDNGKHTLTITLMTWQAGGFWLDYFSVTPNRVTSQPPPPHTTVPHSNSPVVPSHGRNIDQEPSIIRTTIVIGGSSIVTSVTVEPAPPTSVPPLPHSKTEAASSLGGSGTPESSISMTPSLTSVGYSSTGMTISTQIPSPGIGTKPSSRKAIIIGSVLGGLVLILIIIAILFALRASRRRKAPQKTLSVETSG
ncbi:hypothetical protein BDZ94DRAFT_1232247 [Collybia nuda]|uniref:Uncharacterized protein n=1 Tax=Collybia nuda TaxID=64659 RepID=A0A9P6CNW8_9AGAR|nr:hypothetical protein BDZ94DRAFT_1232247 [Collybia nuda]